MTTTKQKNVNIEKKPFRFSEFVKKIFMLNSTKSSARTIANSLWSVVIGIFFGMIAIALVYQVNPFAFVFDIFKFGLTNNAQSHTLALYFGVYGIATIGVAVAFKSGLFNIGVPGQMMLGGIFAFMLMGWMGKDGVVQNDGKIILIFLVAAVVGALFAALAGAMKALFKIHEVVSTIILNWIALFFGTWIWGNRFDQTSLGLPKSNGFGSIVFQANGTLFNDGNIWITTIIIFLLLAAATFVVLTFTSLGYKIKMNGLNKDASSFAGVNQKLTTIGVMAFGGALAGLAGAIYYMFSLKQFSTLKTTQPIIIGFDTIAIALLASNNPLGVILTSFFYAVLQNSDQAIRGAWAGWGVENGGLNIIIGLIIYLAAISNAFSQFKPLRFITKFIALRKQKSYMTYYKNTYKTRKREILDELAVASVHAKALANKNKYEFKRIISLIKQKENEVLLKIQIQTRKNFGQNLEKINPENLSIQQLEAQIAKLREEIKFLKNRLVELKYHATRDLILEKKYEYKIAQTTYVKGKGVVSNASKETLAKIKEDYDKLIHDTKIIEDYNYFEIKSARKLIKTKEKEIKKLQFIIDNLIGKLSPKDIETLFSKLSKEKLELRAELDKLGYTQLSDIKGLASAKLFELRNNKNKIADAAFERFILSQKYISTFAKLNNSVSYLNDVTEVCLKDEKITKDLLANNKLTQEEFDKAIVSLNVKKSNLENVLLIKIAKLNEQIKQINKLKDSKLLERLEQIKKEIKEVYSQYLQEIHAAYEIDMKVLDNKQVSIEEYEKEKFAITSRKEDFEYPTIAKVADLKVEQEEIERLLKFKETKDELLANKEVLEKEWKEVKVNLLTTLYKEENLESYDKYVQIYKDANALLEGGN